LDDFHLGSQTLPVGLRPALPEMNGDWRDWDEANRFMVIFYVIYSMEI
jgi:hypothetical protein